MIHTRDMVKNLNIIYEADELMLTTYILQGKECFHVNGSQLAKMKKKEYS